MSALHLGLCVLLALLSIVSPSSQVLCDSEESYLCTCFFRLLSMSGMRSSSRSLSGKNSSSQPPSPNVQGLLSNESSPGDSGSDDDDSKNPCSQSVSVNETHCFAHYFWCEWTFFVDLTSCYKSPTKLPSSAHYKGTRGPSATIRIFVRRWRLV